MIEWKVSKTTKNPDRVFYSCKECEAFAWQDQIDKLGRCWKCNGRGGHSHRRPRLQIRELKMEAHLLYTRLAERARLRA